MSSPPSASIPTVLARRMTPPTPASTPRSSMRTLTTWTVFFILLAAALVSFFRFADRVPSLLQALAEH